MLYKSCITTNETYFLSWQVIWVTEGTWRSSSYGS